MEMLESTVTPRHFFVFFCHLNVKMAKEFKEKFLIIGNCLSQYKMPHDLETYTVVRVNPYKWICDQQPDYPDPDLIYLWNDPDQIFKKFPSHIPVVEPTTIHNKPRTPIASNLLRKHGSKVNQRGKIIDAFPTTGFSAICDAIYVHKASEIQLAGFCFYSCQKCLKERPLPPSSHHSPDGEKELIDKFPQIHFLNPI